MAAIDRRTLLHGAALFSLAPSASACAKADDTRPATPSSALVVYFTRSGNTRVIAGTIKRALSADLFELRPARPYPEDYEANVRQAAEEASRGFEPQLIARVDRIEQYDKIFLGFPIWGQTAPPVIRSFLKLHDLSARTLQPFITHGGYGIGDSMTVLASHAPRARIQTPFVMEADQERRTLTEVRTWLGTL